MRFLTAILVLLGVLGLVACEEKNAGDANFSAGKKKEEPKTEDQFPQDTFEDPPETDGDDTSDTGDTEDDDSDEGPGCDEDNDAVELEFKDEEMQECVDDGYLWNFDAGECSDMEQTRSFECTYAGLQGWLEYLGIDSNPPKAKKKDKAKLVGCGESESGMIIMAQYWFPPEKGDKFHCKYSKSQRIDVGCYRGFGAEVGGGAAPGSPGDADSEVARCYDGD